MDLAPNHRSGALQSFDRDIALLGIEDAVNLSPAGAHEFREALLGDSFSPHLLAELLSDNGFDSRSASLLLDSFLFEEIVQR